MSGQGRSRAWYIHQCLCIHGEEAATGRRVSQQTNSNSKKPYWHDRIETQYCFSTLCNSLSFSLTHTYHAYVPIMSLCIGMTDREEWTQVALGGKAQLYAACQHPAPSSFPPSSLPFLPLLLSSPLPSSPHVPNASSALCSLTSAPGPLSSYLCMGVVLTWPAPCEFKHFGPRFAKVFSGNF